MDQTNQPIYIYVDVDDTFVRSYGNSRIPIPEVIRHITALWEQGAVLFCWSSGGAEYAEASAVEFGIEHCFTGFLPKPNVIFDDQQVSEWRRLLQIHPTSRMTDTVDSYRNRLGHNEANR